MTANDRFSPALRWLAFALVALPFWQLAGSDFDRSGALVLLGPALWLGRRELLAAWSDWIAGRRLAAGLMIWLLVVSVAATVISTHSAASVVMIARCLIVANAAVLAGRVVRTEPTATPLLAGALAGGALGGVLFVWVAWFNGHQAPFPLYFNPRHIGYHTLMAAIAATFLILRAGSTRAVKLGWLAAGVIVWAGLFWSGGRAPIAALAGALALVAWRRPWQEIKALLGVAALQLVGGLILSQLLAGADQAVGWWHAVERTTQAPNVSSLTSARSDFWLAAWHHYLEAPILGLGPDAYQFLVPKLDGQQPHNFLLQFLLDGGILGAIPSLLLLGLSWFYAWIRPLRTTANSEFKTAPTPWVWPGVLTAGTLLGLLDGSFYHLIGLLPLALAWGICLYPATAAPSAKAPTLFPRAAAIFTFAATVVLIFHGWLFFQVAVAAPPAGPKDFVAQAWRRFPSPTLGLTRWFAAWGGDYPADALEWTLWTLPRTPNATLFHVLAARLLLEQGQRVEAKAQLELALAEAERTRRPYVQSLLDQNFPTPSSAAPPR